MRPIFPVIRLTGARSGATARHQESGGRFVADGGAAAAEAGTGPEIRDAGRSGATGREPDGYAHGDITPPDGSVPR
ncbi:hypothetical protein GCM10027615_34980 [Plantactinospora veratri]